MFKFILTTLIFNYLLLGNSQKFATDIFQKKYGKIVHASVVSL